MILEVNFFAFAYRLFHEDFSPINRALKAAICIHQADSPLNMWPDV